MYDVLRKRLRFIAKVASFLMLGFMVFISTLGYINLFQSVNVYAVMHNIEAYAAFKHLVTAFIIPFLVIMTLLGIGMCFMIHGKFVVKRALLYSVSLILIPIFALGIYIYDDMVEAPFLIHFMLSALMIYFITVLPIISFTYLPDNAIDKLSKLLKQYLSGSIRKGN
jgi:hypothetical protein